MALYSIALFLHIVGSLALFAGLGIEWLSVRRLRSAATIPEVIEWTHPFGALRRLYPASMITILASGLYMAGTVWGHVWWAVIGLLAMVLLGLLGTVLTGDGIAAIRRVAEREDGAVSPALRARLRSDRLWVSVRARLAVGLGIVFLMSVKPGLPGSLVAMIVFVAAGLAARRPGWRRRVEAAAGRMIDIVQHRNRRTSRP